MNNGVSASEFTGFILLLSTVILLAVSGLVLLLTQTAQLELKSTQHFEQRLLLQGAVTTHI